MVNRFDFTRARRHSDDLRIQIRMPASDDGISNGLLFEEPFKKVTELVGSILLGLAESPTI